jgi:fucose permease
VRELFPLLFGILLALAVQRIASLRSRVFVLIACSTAGGAIASLISGELSVSATYLVIDIALVLIAAGLTTALTTSRQRWLPRRWYSGG